MAGIYLHIPFCKKICPYCDFHKSAYLGNKEMLIRSVLKEIILQKDFLGDEKVESIYFGGGTPSLLDPAIIEELTEQIRSCFSVEPTAEITLEANPDDISGGYLKSLKNTGVNRLSIGCQSFNDKILKFLGRRHNARQSYEAVLLAKEKGFENVSLDLIYGIPGQKRREWVEDLEKAFQLKTFHLSAYHLTFEENTIFYKKLKSGEIKEVNENLSNELFQTLIKQATQNSFIHYEISNFEIGRAHV